MTEKVNDVVQYPNAILSTPTVDVVFPCPELRDLVYEMRQAMQYGKRGVGIAAPQIGSQLRVCVVVDRTLVNPRIISYSKDDEVVMMEGCLSVAASGQRAEITRYRTIVVEYQNIRGKKETKKFSDFTARIVQHEIDHLDGFCIVDRAPHAFTLGSG